MSSVETVKKFNKLKEKLNEQGLDFILTGELVLYLFYGLDREVSEINLVVTNKEGVVRWVNELGYSDCVGVNEVKKLNFYDEKQGIKISRPNSLRAQRSSGLPDLLKLYDLLFMERKQIIKPIEPDIFYYSYDVNVLDCLLFKQGHLLSESNKQFLMEMVANKMQTIHKLRKIS